MHRDIISNIKTEQKQVQYRASYNSQVWLHKLILTNIKAFCTLALFLLCSVTILVCLLRYMACFVALQMRLLKKCFSATGPMAFIRSNSCVCPVQTKTLVGSRYQIPFEE